MGDESLPEGLSPLLIDGLITSQYEEETLPLLFAEDGVFDQYYCALIEKNEALAPALQHIRTKNLEAREHRAAGRWQECLDMLMHCVYLRRCVYEDSEFQFVAALTHFVLSTVTYGNFFLGESIIEAVLTTKDTHFGKAFELFQRAKEAVEKVPLKQQQMLLRAIVMHNIGTLYFRRGKKKAAAQAMHDSFRAWAKSKAQNYNYYFLLCEGTACLFSSRFPEALQMLQAAAENLPLPTTRGETEDENGHPIPQRPAETKSPAPTSAQAIPYQPQLLSIALPLVPACSIATYANAALASLTSHHYQEAATWCTRALDMAAAHRTMLGAHHPWIKLLRKLQDHCSKQAFSATYTRYKMRPSEYRIKEFPVMQKIIMEARTMPAFTAMIASMHQQRAKAQFTRQHLASLTLPEPGDPEPVGAPILDVPDKEDQGTHQEGQTEQPQLLADATMPSEPAPTPPVASSPVKVPHPPKTLRAPRAHPALSFLPNIPQKGKPLAALKVYTGYSSHRRIVEDFTNKCNVRSKEGKSEELPAEENA
eukprot:TRINITY_DN3163_c0_g1_i1.p1 TRINITY_DN3163_c0_g1~~TRINITY_DN3163_c0_g1_i1.p1  ORF type:complete len:544 (+),score=60.54 TRINITY_DN3163_c0_g1_i1:25-1632(+)